MSKVSAIQMTSTDSVKENLITAHDLINQAASEGAQLVVLPEMFPILGVESTDKVNVSETFGQGVIQDFLAKQAQTHGIWIVGGTIPLKCDIPNKISAACLVYDDQGEVKGRYDKIHLFDVAISESEQYQESATTVAGTEFGLVNTPFGTLGLSVCYDIRFPELYRKLFNLGAQIFVVPAAFTVKTGRAHWEVLARSRAIENFSYVIGACQTGLHKNGRSTYGHSLIVNPWGDILASLPDKEGIITADIDLEKLAEIRKSIPVAEHQKFFF